MKDQILNHLNEPHQLEKLYRQEPLAFKRAFTAIYPELKESVLAAYWHERLNFTAEETSWGTRNDLIFVLIASLFAGLIAKLPAIFTISEDFFYPRNIGFIVFPVLTLYFARKNKLAAGKLAILAGIILAGVLFINLLAATNKSDTLVLSCIHLVLCLWSVLGFAFVGHSKLDEGKRLDFLKYNGDLVVMGTLILIAGGITSALTIGLFSLIGLHIEKFYFENVVVMGLAAVPLVATTLIQTNPQLVGKVSPVIAKLFGPVVLVMLVIYLFAMGYSARNPYNDREFLLIFNALLVGVMAIIFFSIAGTSNPTKSVAETWILFLLSLVTLIVNGIAISAILFRISAGGITPNRAAVLGSNILILVHLLLVSVQLYRAVSKKGDISGVGKTIAFYLPVYCVWAAFVTFVFPLLFGLR